MTLDREYQSIPRYVAYTNSLEYSSGMDTSGRDTYGSGRDQSDDYNRTSGQTGQTDQTETGRTKPSMGDRVKGTAEELMGKVKKNPDQVERGQMRQVRLFHSTH